MGMSALTFGIFTPAGLELQRMKHYRHRKENKAAGSKNLTCSLTIIVLSKDG